MGVTARTSHRVWSLGVGGWKAWPIDKCSSKDASVSMRPRPCARMDRREGREGERAREKTRDNRQNETQEESEKRNRCKIWMCWTYQLGEISSGVWFIRSQLSGSVPRDMFREKEQERRRVITERTKSKRMEGSTELFVVVVEFGLLFLVVVFVLMSERKV